MSILSFSFLFFVLGLLVVYYIIPQKFRWIILLLGSIIFYYLSSGKLILFLIFSTIVIYLVGLQIDKYNEKLTEIKNVTSDDEEKKILKEIYNKKKKRILLFGIILNIFCIILTKYSGFVLENVNQLFSIININFSFSLKNILVPLGISYYTLEAISYVVDVYRGKYRASKNIFKVALYLLYFPKVIEGPISKFNELSKDFYENNKLDFQNIIIGLDLIVLGLFKKMVIADRAGIYVNEIFGSNHGGITTILAMVLYTVQIYAEFSGCIDIVRGVSRSFGIQLPINFKRPFFSKSIQEFWQRWHISLGAWIREYVFFPISLSKLNAKVSRFCKDKLSRYFYKFITIAFPLFFVWLVNGLWHGASYKYIVYGMYYYGIMMIGLLLKPVTDFLCEKIKLKGKLLVIFQILRTCIFVIIGMTLFRASSLPEFGQMLISIFKSGNGIFDFGLCKIDYYILLLGNLFILMIGILEEKKIINIENGFTENIFVRSIVYSLLICLIIVFGIYGEGYDASSFIYGAF